MKTKLFFALFVVIYTATSFSQSWTHEVSISEINSAMFPVRTNIGMIVFVWFYKNGIHKHNNINSIRIKKHGRKTKTIFKLGLDYITMCFLNANFKPNINIFSFLSCT